MAGVLTIVVIVKTWLCGAVQIQYYTVSFIMSNRWRTKIECLDIALSKPKAVSKRIEVKIGKIVLQVGIHVDWRRLFLIFGHTFKMAAMESARHSMLMSRIAPMREKSIKLQNSRIFRLPSKALTGPIVGKMGANSVYAFYILWIWVRGRYSFGPL